MQPQGDGEERMAPPRQDSYGHDLCSVLLQGRSRILQVFVPAIQTSKLPPLSSVFLLSLQILPGADEPAQSFPCSWSEGSAEQKWQNCPLLCPAG